MPPAWFARQRQASGSRRLNLLILHRDEFPTAIEVYRQWFPQRGHRVLWVLQGQGDRAEVVEQMDAAGGKVWLHRRRDARKGSRLTRVLVNRWRKLRGFALKCCYLWRATGQEDFDVIQARDLVGDGVLAWIVARLRRTGFAYQLDYMHQEASLFAADLLGRRLSPIQRLRRQLLIQVRDFLLRRADVAFVISDEMRRQFLRHGLREEACYVFPTGVKREFLERRLDRGAARKRLGVGDEPVLAYVGNLTLLRGVDLILDIMKGVVEAQPRTRILLVSHEVAGLEGPLRQRGLWDRLLVGGPLPHDQVPDVLAGADVGIFPLHSRDDFGLVTTSSPLKVQEYVVCGVPFVSSPIPEVVEMVANSGCGVVVPEDVEAFVAATVDLMNRPQEGAKMARRGREWILRYKACDVMAPFVEAAYQERLAPRPGTRSAEVSGTSS